jgi:hypothetical protein
MATDKRNGVKQSVEGFKDFVFPFETRVSFAPVFEHLYQGNGLSPDFKIFITNSIDQFKKECSDRGDDPNDIKPLERHPALLKTMGNVLFPLTAAETHTQVITPPFSLDPILVTPSFDDS